MTKEEFKEFIGGMIIFGIPLIMALAGLCE